MEKLQQITMKLEISTKASTKLDRAASLHHIMQRQKRQSNRRGEGTLRRRKVYFLELLNFQEGEKQTTEDETNQE